MGHTNLTLWCSITSISYFSIVMYYISKYKFHRNQSTNIINRHVSQLTYYNINCIQPVLTVSTEIAVARSWNIRQVLIVRLAANSCCKVELQIPKAVEHETFFQLTYQLCSSESVHMHCRHYCSIKEQMRASRSNFHQYTTWPISTQQGFTVINWCHPPTDSK